MIYKSPGGPPLVPGDPLPASLIFDPSFTPAGMVTSIVSVEDLNPDPPHSLQTSPALPVPPQSGHVLLNCNGPWATPVCPVPLQVRHTSPLTGLIRPEPPQAGHGLLVCIVTLLDPPWIAVLKSSSRVDSASLPFAGPLEL